MVFEGDKDATDGIKWTSEDGASVSEITPDKKGVTKLIATSGSKKMNVYVVAKEKNENEYDVEIKKNNQEVVVRSKVIFK